MSAESIRVVPNSRLIDGEKLDNAPDDINTELATKVDKVVGKGLSTEDYSTAEKDKLFGVETGAEVNTLNDVIAGSNISIDKTDPLNPVISSTGGSGTGDMLKATYDINNNGIVDNAEKVNNLTVETAVPIGAVFTDTTYTVGDGGLTEINFTSADNIKLDGIEAGAEVNNISDVNATDLTDGLDSTLHYHAADRARANHTGTQLASTISDFDTQVATIADMLASTYDPSAIEKDLFATHQIINVDVAHGSDTTGNGSIHAPYATIQKAIDTSTGSISIELTPGTYPGNITLRTGVQINGSLSIISGLVTCSGGNIFNKIDFTRAVTASDLFIDAETNLSNLSFNSCNVSITTSTDNIQPKMIGYNNAGSSISVSNTSFNYTNTSTGANTAETCLICGTGAGNTVWNGNSIIIHSTQPSGDISAIKDDTSGIVAIVSTLSFFTIANASYSGSMVFYKSTTSGINKKIFNNDIIITGAGSGTGIAVELDQVLGQVVKSNNNSFSITGFANNYHANVVNALDNFKTFNDESNALDGVIGAGIYEQDPLWNFFNGAIEEKVSYTVDSDTTTITASVEKLGGGDLTLRYSTGRIKFASSPAATVALTPGTDEVPLKNYIFIPKSTGVLTSNTTGFPVVEHSRIGIAGCQSALTLAADGPMLIQSTQDSLEVPGANGHMSHINEWIRNQYATYIDGMVQSNTGSGTATVNFSLTSGNIFQLHKNSSPNHVSPASAYIVNDSITAFTKETNLANILLDANGVSINNKYFAIVLWQNVSSVEADSKLLINLPSGSYSSEADARADGEKYTNFTIPPNTKNAGVLVHRYICRNSGGVLTIFPGAGDDLRGTLPNTAGGSSTSVGTVFQDGTFRVENTADNTKVLALDASTITTGNTRTLTVPDTDGTLSLIANTETLTNKTLTSPVVNTPTGIVTNDVTESTDKNYVTDAEAIVIGNTSNTNSGDQTSIVGITGTKAQFNTAVTDGDIVYVGDNITGTSSNVTGIVAVANGGTGSATAAGARTNLNVDVAGTDNSTNVTVTDTAEIDLTLVGQDVKADLKTTTVVAGSYTSSNITVDSKGRITSASTGSAGDTGNIEILTADKVISSGDDAIQMLDPNGANRNVTLPAASSGDRFRITNNDDSNTAANYLIIKDNGLTTFDNLYTGSSASYIFDGTNWLSEDGLGGAEGSNDNNLSIGYNSKGFGSGTALGSSSSGYTFGAALGNNSDGNSYGTSIGTSSAGIFYGAALGYNTYGSYYGVSVGGESDGHNYGLAIGYRTISSGSTNSYSGAIGWQFKNAKDNYIAFCKGTGITDTTSKRIGFDFTESGKVAMEVNDSTSAPTITTNKLYSLAGALAWNGTAVIQDLSGLMVKANNLSDLTNTTTARSNLNVDIAGTDNSTNVTLAGTPNYITIVGQVITRALINLTSHVTGTLPIANGGTGSTTKNFVDITTGQIVAGIKTFSSFPISPSSAPTTDYQVANKKYVDDNAGGSGVTIYDGIIAGEQIVGEVFETPLPGAATLAKFKISLKTLPTGADFIAKVYKNGVADASATILTTATATNGLYIANDTTFVSGSYVENDRITVSITQIGSSVNGSDFTFSLS